MTTFTLDEALRNQVLAALDERAARLSREVERLQTPPRDEFHERPCAACGMALGPDESHWNIFAGVMGEYVCPDWQRALVWNIAALHETNMARLAIGEAGPAWTESELRVAAGNR